ncbi:MAG: hypothetical protein H6Q89_3421 [Myxococcaceae bacterium]|nr:hypothetical protein [Myxococcaceae bacterium]
MTEKLVFNSAMEGLIQAVRVEISPRCWTRMKTLGFDSEAKLLPAYPSTLWAGVVKILGEEIYPGLTPFEAHRRLAIRTVEVYAQSVIGGAMFTVANLLGPDRTVRRMTRNFRTGSNFVETTCNELSPHTYEIGVNDVSEVAGFYGGMLEAGFLRTGARSLSVKLHDEKAPGAIFRVNWAA